MRDNFSGTAKMTSNWVGLTIALVLIAPIVVWLRMQIVRAKRHPGTVEPRSVLRTHWLLGRDAMGILGVLLISLGLLCMLWVFLSWLTHGMATGHWAHLAPTTSPWKRLMYSQQFRPWNLCALGVLYFSLVALQIAMARRRFLIIRNSLQRVTSELGLSLLEDASNYAMDWSNKHFNLPAAFASSTPYSDEDLTLMLNACWAVHARGDSLRLLVASYGPGLKQMGKYPTGSGAPR